MYRRSKSHVYFYPKVVLPDYFVIPQISQTC